MVDTWAFGTSPHGLGLTEEYLWSLTPREYAELRKVWQSGRDHSARLVAVIQATLHNAHWPSEIPFQAEDFTGTGDRAARVKQAAKEKYELMRVNQRLARMKPNEKTPGLPEWAVN